MNIIDRLIKRMYAPREHALTGTWDLVVPHDYGAQNGKDVLPDGTIRNLEAAIEMVKNGTARQIAWGTTNHFLSGEKDMDQEKLRLLLQSGLPQSKIRAIVKCDNTIEEIENILGAAPEARRIISVSDWRHGPRIMEIWRQLPFTGEVAIRTTDCIWDKRHKSGWCKSKWIFLLMNLGYHTLLVWRGIEKLRGLKHPVSTTL